MRKIYIFLFLILLTFTVSNFNQVLAVDCNCTGVAWSACEWDSGGYYEDRTCSVNADSTPSNPDTCNSEIQQIQSCTPPQPTNPPGGGGEDDPDPTPWPAPACTPTTFIHPTCINLGSSFTLSIGGVTNATGVHFPVWNNALEGGDPQGDIDWYSGVETGGKWEKTSILQSEHDSNNPDTSINAHVYLSNPSYPFPGVACTGFNSIPVPCASRNVCKVQGYKIGDPASQTISYALEGSNFAEDSTTAQPYNFSDLFPSTNYVISSTTPSGYSVGYTLCYNRTDCHTVTPTPGSVVTVNIPSAPPNCYADLWWKYTPITTPTPLPPTATPVPGCLCSTDGISTDNNYCASVCAFDKFSPPITYPNSIKCSLSSSLFPTPPSLSDKNSWCQRNMRTKGDADGNSIFNTTDYFYYVAAVSGGIIPMTANPDFDGDGAVSNLDREIIIKSLNSL